MLLLAPALQAQPFERQVEPFPVLDAGGQPYRLPLLGGLRLPRPQFADVDADGDLDLFVQEAGGLLLFLENTGTPTDPAFTWRSDRYRDLAVGQWTRLADLDADGDLDVLTESPEQFGLMRFYRNAGTPQQPAFTLAADPLVTAAGDTLFADPQNTPALGRFDCDALPDLFLGRLDGRLTYYRHDGLDDNGMPRFALVDETYADVCAGPASVCGFGKRAVEHSERHGANVVTLGDAGADGDADLLWGDFFSQSLYFIENQGTCDAPDLRLVSDTFPLDDPLLTAGFNAPELADLDADGDLDLFAGVLADVGGASVDNVVFLEHTASGFTHRTSRFVYVVDVGRESHPAFADVDQDGDLDLLVGNAEAPENPGRASVSLFRNTGTPEAPAFRLADTDVVPLPEGFFSATPAAADLDADGDPDLIVGRFDGSLTCFQNDEATFAASEAAACGLPVGFEAGNYSAPSLTDLDDDSDFDLLVGSSRGTLTFLRNEGTPSQPAFTLVTTEYAGIDAGRRSQSALADTNGDGDLDLLVGHADGLAFYRNTGTPQQPAFAPDTLPSIDAPTLAAPAPADLDADGDLDLIFGLERGGLVYYANTRLGSSIAPAPSPTEGTALLPNAPNPFDAVTTLRFRLDHPARAALVVYDLLGRRVTHLDAGSLAPGTHAVALGVRALPAGVYLVRLFVDDVPVEARKVVRR